MAKKRRRGGGRTRISSPTRGPVGTAERRDGAAAEAREPRAGPRTDERATAPREDGTHVRGAAPQRSRTEKKELARRQREEIRRRVRRAERTRQLAWIAGITVVIGVAVFFFTRSDGPSTRPDTLPGELTDEAPWSANADLAAERADLIDLPSHGDTLAMHDHANVQVFVHGDPVAIPVNVGIDEADGDVESLHTHTADGVVHIESSTRASFTLGQFFDVWGVRLSATCIGGYCEGADDTLRVFKDGDEFTGTIREVVLDNESMIVVTFGTQDEVPDPLPTFDFSTIQP
jgi:hypothetical protein